MYSQQSEGKIKLIYYYLSLERCLEETFIHLHKVSHWSIMLPLISLNNFFFLIILNITIFKNLFFLLDPVHCLKDPFGFIHQGLVLSLFLIKSVLYPNFLISVEELTQKIVSREIPLSHVLSTKCGKNRINLLLPFARKMSRRSVYSFTFGIPRVHYVSLNIVIYFFVYFIIFNITIFKELVFYLIQYIASKTRVNLYISARFS